MDLDTTVRDLSPKVLRYCRARLSRAELSEEIAQESLMALVQRWRRHGPPDNPTAFVLAIARRRAFRASVKAKVWESLETLRGHQDPRSDPERQTIERERLDRLRRSLAELPAAEREALLLVAVVGLDRAAASAALGISGNALKMRLSRARRRLEEKGEVALATT